MMNGPESSASPSSSRGRIRHSRTILGVNANNTLSTAARQHPLVLEPRAALGLQAGAPLCLQPPVTPPRRRAPSLVEPAPLVGRPKDILAEPASLIAPPVQAPAALVEPNPLFLEEPVVVLGETIFEPTVVLAASAAPRANMRTLGWSSEALSRSDVALRDEPLPAPRPNFEEDFVAATAPRVLAPPLPLLPLTKYQVRVERIESFPEAASAYQLADAIAAGVLVPPAPAKTGRIIFGMALLTALSVASTTFIAHEIEAPPPRVDTEQVVDAVRSGAASLSESVK